jgi:hypothetical protein
MNSHRKEVAHLRYWPNVETRFDGFLDAIE